MPRALSSLVAATAALILVAALGACTGAAEPRAAASPPAGTSSTTVPAGLHTAELAELYAGNSAVSQDRREGRCFARAFEQRMDEAALVRAGIVDRDGTVVESLPIFDATTATAWVDAQLACVDYVEASTRALLTQTRGALDAQAYAVCLRAALSDEEVRAALVQTLSGGFDSPEVAALADAQSTCAT